MLKLKSIVLVATVLLSIPHFAQQYIESNNQNGSNINQDIQNYIARANKYHQPDTNGSPYLNEQFEPGSLLNENGVVIPTIFLRYNALHDEFQIKQYRSESDDNVQAVRRAPDIYVKIKDAIFTYVLPGNGVGGYYNILFEGDKTTLYKKYSKKFVAGRESVTKLTGDVPNRLIDKNTYFVVNSKGEFTELSSTRNKKFEAIAGEKRNELKKIAKSKGLNINKEEDLIQLIEYYNHNF